MGKFLKSKASMAVVAAAMVVAVFAPSPGGAQGDEDRGDEEPIDAPPVITIEDETPVLGLGAGELAESIVGEDPTAGADFENVAPAAPHEPLAYDVPEIDDSARLADVLDQLDDQGLIAVADQLQVRPTALPALAADDGLRLHETGLLFYEDPIPAPQAAEAAPSTPEAGPFPNSQTFKLHSKPGSNRVLYLDFQGETVSGTAWRGGATINVPAWYGTSISQAEHDLIQDVWRRVAEDYAPFDVDVTTEFPGTAAITRSSSTDQTYGSHVLITPGPWSDYNVCGSPCGGVAYVGVFDWYLAPGHAYYQPAWVHGGSLGQDVKNIAEASSHEAGHNLGLRHDGRTSPSEEYYAGHNMWAPIMGNSYNRPVSQWSLGEYTNSSQTQDDVTTIIPSNGALVRADDHTDSLTTAATNITVPLTSALDRTPGVISVRTDQDTFEYVGDCASGSTITFRALNAPSSPNLDIKATLFNNAGGQIAVNNPAAAYVSRDFASGMDATITRTIANNQRVYFQIDGVNAGNANNGFTDYGSLGQFTVDVSEAAPSNDAFPGTSLSGPAAPHPSSVQINGTNCGATYTTAEPATNGGTVWYNWTAPTNGKVFITTCDDSTNFDTFLQVYTGTNQGALNVVASSQNSAGAWCDDTTHSRIVAMSVTQGTNYKIRVRGWNGDKGDFLLTIKYHWCFINGVKFTPTIIGSPVAETLTGTAGNDTILAYGGNDVLDGLGGDDRLCGGHGNDKLYGRDGADFLSGDLDDDDLFGHGGNDRLYGGSGNDFLDGFAGDDLMYGQNGNDRMEGFSGNDVMWGGSGNDNMFGEGGNDRMYGTDGNDAMRGDDGIDRLFGGNGIDKLFGGDGNDLMYGQGDADELQGQAGNDTLNGGDGNDDIFGGTGLDKLIGGNGADELRGGTENDELFGGTGNDDLFGDAGDDLLSGNDGADDMNGGAGTNDRCFGGNGSPDTQIACEIFGGVP